ncbi:MAG: 3D domain-containing protein [Patescibacteria group bacterium]|nr:3D domain-containing protein [Patescibacteria group bacterium]
MILLLPIVASLLLASSGKLAAPTIGSERRPVIATQQETDRQNEVREFVAHQPKLAALLERQTHRLEYPVSATITVMATGYSSGPNSVTYTGITPRWGVVAVDPRVIPLGARLMIPDFPGVVFRAEDTGGLIKGHRIDIWFPNVQDALNWGVRTVKIQLLR